MAKTRPSCFGETMLENTVVLCVSELHGRPPKFFRGEYGHFAYRFAGKRTFNKRFTYFLPQKIPP